MPSPLSFDSTENFRKKLLTRNLKSYGNTNFTANSSAGTNEFNIADYSVVDSPSIEDVGNIQEKVLYVTNKFGPDGGFQDVVDINEDNGTQSNFGEYDYYASQPSRETSQSRNDAFIQNVYGPEGGFDNVITISDVQRIIGTREVYYKFVASTYTSANILLQLDPLGNNGPLSQDSDLAKIGAESLRKDFIDRVAQETYQETVARANFLPGNNPAYGPLGVLTGRVPLIEPDWQISVPGSLVGKGLDFISRVTGVYSPFSWIPGDYFALEDKKSFLNQAANAITGIFDRKGTLKLPTNKTSSDIFLANSGGGTRSTLFRNLTYNDYRPDYKGNFIGEINLGAPTANYYVGSRTSEPIDIISPNNELPQDKDGNKIQTAVRGYGELGKIYENNLEFKFGLNTTSSYDDGGIQGGFTWVSSQNSGVGIRVGRGGQPFDSDNEFNQIAATFDGSRSTNQSESFREGSILYDTQRLIDSAERLQGDARLQHVGNAINQVSKVFNDGYQELTKGSRVIRYSQDNGYSEGYEYCRVFTKDTPYYTTGDLQKRTGNIRDFDSSVLSSTYNLNIAPTSGVDSTTLDLDGAKVKKYMFSLENLAWRTSNRPGLTYDDLALCEKGPNGGRIMWFPPYDLDFSEQVSTRWTENTFLGRVEPVYTYNNTSRSGNLSWTILVDQPSILNLIVDKELERITPDSKVTQIVDSFFAGCLEYDIYELARKFPQFSLKDIYDIVTTTQNDEDYVRAKSEVAQANPQTAEKSYTPQLQSYEGLRFFFGNDVPEEGDEGPYDELYQSYIALSSTTYTTNVKDETTKTAVQNFFSTVIGPDFARAQEMLGKIYTSLEQGATIVLKMNASASSPGSVASNKSLSERRLGSVREYIANYNGTGSKKMSDYIDEGRLKFQMNASGEAIVIDGVNCGEELTFPDKIYSTQAMGCRRATLATIEEIPPVNEDEAPLPEIEDDLSLPTPEAPRVQQANTVTNVRPDIAKRVLRKVLSECSYFELMKEDSPFVYNSIKEKIKYFQPAFHSITPEGLNSRLTFLQQCMRPGDTIPTIGPDGELIYNDAFNTAFGAPPVCILRIGDFFHTKIVIDSLDIQYNPLTLDLNPEGIGLQPMLAKVSMSFKFIGGQGLAEPVAKLQNALSFNYYANTEMYDDRADVTEPVKEKYNAQILEAIEGIVGFSSSDRRNQNTREGGNTIGVVTSENIGGTGSTIDSVTGQINYQQFMDSFVSAVKDYADTSLSVLEDVNDAYYIGGLRMFTTDRKYIEGQFGLNSSPFVLPKLVGKPENLQSKIDGVFDGASSDVNSGASPLLANINNVVATNSEIRLYKKTIKEVITERKATFNQFFDNNINSLVESEQNLIRFIDKTNFVTSESDGATSGTDGYLLKQGEPVIYSITGTTPADTSSTGAANTLDELIDDFTTLGNDLQELYQKFLDYSIINGPDDKFTNDLSFDCLDTSISSTADKRLFIVFAREIVENTEAFISKLTPGEVGANSNFVSYVTGIVNSLKTDYTDSYNNSQKFFQNFKSKYFTNKYTEYRPFNSGKTRVFDFSKPTTPNPANLTNIKALYSGQNSGGSDSYNDKVKLN
jgi:hypothetical protein